MAWLFLRIFQGDILSSNFYTHNDKLYTQLPAPIQDSHFAMDIHGHALVVGGGKYLEGCDGSHPHMH